MGKTVATQHNGERRREMETTAVAQHSGETEEMKFNNVSSQYIHASQLRKVTSHAITTLR